MNLEELDSALRETGYAVTYDQFEGEEPALPWIAYYETNSDNFQADDTVYLNIRDIRIELYTKQKNVDVEARVEEILNKNGLVFNSVDEAIDEEDLYLHAYDVRIWW